MSTTPRESNRTLFCAALIALAAAQAAGAASYTFSSFFGGNNVVGRDVATAVAVDGSGNTYVVGSTSSSPGFPTTAGVVQPASAGGDDIFVAKFDGGGSLVYSTLLGGSGNDNPLAVTVDSTGAAYLTGTTTSADFPVTVGTVQEIFGGGSDVFVVKLSPDASSLVYGTYLGGTSTTEVGGGIAVDAAGSAYVTGRTASTDFPTTAGAFDVDCGLGGNCTASKEDAFVSKLDPTGSSLVYSTFLGGDKRDVGHHVAVDAAGVASVVGLAASSDFPVTGNAFAAASAGGNDGFVVQLSAAGDALVYSTYLGGSGTDLIVGLDIDAAGDLYLGGYTRSDDFPTTAGAFDVVCGSGTCSGSLDAFATKLSPDGSAPAYSTFLGGSGLDFGFGVAVDDDGQLHIAGTTTSTDFPVQDPIGGALTSNATCALDGSGIETGAPCSDLYVAKLTADGSALLFSDFVGGSDGETLLTVPSFNHNLALTGAGEMVVVGVTHSVDYPTASAFQAALVGGSDAVVTRIGDLPGTDTTPPTADAGANQAIHAGSLVIVDGSGSFDDNTAGLDLLYQWSFVSLPIGSGAVLSGAANSSASFVADLPGTYVLDLVVTDEAGLVSAPDEVEISSFNVTPVADAGLDQIVVVDDVSGLDGSGSSDADGDSLSYAWTLDSAPVGSSAGLTGAASVLATLQPDVVGSYVISLIVNDGFVDSPSDQVEITAITAADLAESKLLGACDLVSALPAGAFDAPGHQNVLCNFMSQAVRDIDKGKTSKAISKIDDALERTDGCVLRGAPDPKGGQGADWIVGCADQVPVYESLGEARSALD